MAKPTPEPIAELRVKLRKEITLPEEDVASYKQLFRMAVRTANDYANRRTGHDPNIHQLEKNQLRVQFLTEDLGPNFGGDKIAKIMKDSASGKLKGHVAAAEALKELAEAMKTSSTDQPSLEAPEVKVIKKTPSPS